MASDIDSPSMVQNVSQNVIDYTIQRHRLFSQIKSLPVFVKSLTLFLNVIKKDIPETF